MAASAATELPPMRAMVVLSTEERSVTEAAEDKGGMAVVLDVVVFSLLGSLGVGKNVENLVLVEKGM